MEWYTIEVSDGLPLSVIGVEDEEWIYLRAIDQGNSQIVDITSLIASDGVIFIDAEIDGTDIELVALTNDSGVYYLSSFDNEMASDIGLVVWDDDLSTTSEHHVVNIDNQETLDIICNMPGYYTTTAISVIDNESSNQINGAYVFDKAASNEKMIYIPENTTGAALVIEMYDGMGNDFDYDHLTPTMDVYDYSDSSTVEVDGLSISTVDANEIKDEYEIQQLSIGDYNELLNIYCYDGTIGYVDVKTPDSEDYSGSVTLVVQYIYNGGSDYAYTSSNGYTESGRLTFPIKNTFNDIISIKVMAIPIYHYDVDEHYANSMFKDISESIEFSYSFDTYGELILQEPTVIGHYVDEEENIDDEYIATEATFHDSEDNDNSFSVRITNDDGYIYLALMDDKLTLMDIEADIYDSEFDYVMTTTMTDIPLNEEEPYEFDIPIYEEDIIALIDSYELYVSPEVSSSEMIEGTVTFTYDDTFYLYVPENTAEFNINIEAFDENGDIIELTDVSVTIGFDESEDSVVPEVEGDRLSVGETINENMDISYGLITVGNLEYNVVFNTYAGELGQLSVETPEGDPYASDVIVSVYAENIDSTEEIGRIAPYDSYDGIVYVSILNPDFEIGSQKLLVEPVDPDYYNITLANSQYIDFTGAEETNGVYDLGTAVMEEPILSVEVYAVDDALIGSDENVIVEFKFVDGDEASSYTSYYSHGGYNCSSMNVDNSLPELIKVSVYSDELEELLYYKEVVAGDITIGVNEVYLVEEDSTSYVEKETTTNNNTNNTPSNTPYVPLVKVEEVIPEIIPDIIEKGSRIIFSQGSETEAVAKGNIKEFVDNGEKELVVDSKVATLVFDEATLKGIANEIDGEVTIETKVIDNITLSETLKVIVGNNKVYDFNMMAGDKKITGFDGSVKVSIPYKLTTIEDEDALIVYYINDNGELELITNGHYENGFITFTTTHFSKYMVSNNKINFSDVSGWYSDYVDYLASRQIMKGKGVDAFDPSGTLTRAEAIQILANLSGEILSAPSSNFFEDVDKDAWYAKAIDWAKEEGLAKGSNGMFNPTDAISRQDLAVMINRYVENYLDSGLKSNVDSIDFTDQSEISGYAITSVSMLQLSGIIGGTPDGEFLPKNVATRAEAAKIFAMLLKSI